MIDHEIMVQIDDFVLALEDSYTMDQILDSLIEYVSILEDIYCAGEL
jgi:hypothetical protein